MSETLLLSLLLGLTGAGPAAVYVEAEDLPYTGSWSVVSETGAFGAGLLLATDVVAALPAVGAVNVPAAGRYRLMVRARDFPADRPGIRRFAVEVNGVRAEREFGAHGRADAGGWDWEDGGPFELPAGEVLVALAPLTGYCRCDALALVRDGEDVPHGSAQAKAMATPLPPLPPAEPIVLATVPAGVTREEPLARLQSDSVRLTFLPIRLPDAQTVAVRIEVARDGRWSEVVPPAPESYLVLRAEPEVQLRPGIWPRWSKPVRPEVLVERRGVSYRTLAGADSWILCAGRPAVLHPSPAVEPSAERVVLRAVDEVGTVETTWALPAGERFPQVTFRFVPTQPGRYGLGYGLGPAVPRDEVREVLAPLLYGFRRLPREPKLMPLEMISARLAAIQTDAGTYGLALDADLEPNGWPDFREIAGGFQLVDATGAARPTAWSPLPGGPGSDLSAGDEARLALSVLASDEDAFGAYRLAATALCGLRDYRRNVDLSLTDTTLNVIDLLKNDEAAGWSDEGLAPWNIEMRATTTQAAPLAILGAALLTGDEDLLARRAIPSLAFLASRPNAHFDTDPAGAGSHRLGGPTTLYGAAVRQAAAALTNGWSPIFDELARDPGAVTRGYSKARPFEDLLAVWRATGDEDILARAKADLRSYVESYEAAQTEELSPVPFYQITYSGNWEGLLHGAEVLGDDAARQVAVRLARRMITGLWAWPEPRDEPITVHPGGVFEGNGYCWWRGFERYLLGFPAPSGNETHVPPAQVSEERCPEWWTSPVGLGIEQPVTYRRDRSPGALIVMANWAPGLLRLAAAAGDPLLATAAHNAVLGRWGNYPGYYVTGRSTLPARADYPYRGPDVSGIYYHHIPPFLAFLLDYLVTDVEVRSDGAIRFPAERQLGYAWFDNRVFGHRPGRVYEIDGVWPWLRRGLVALDTPLVNWLAGHTVDAVYLMLTNTTDEPVTASVRLSAELTGGARGPVRTLGPGSRPLELVDGAVQVNLAPQGLVTLEWRGCAVTVPLHEVTPLRAANGAATHAEAVGDAVVGTVRATWLAVGPRHSFVHIYSDHDGSHARRARLAITQSGRTTTLQRATWPLEFIVPVAPASATLRLVAIDEVGAEHPAPAVTIEPPRG